MRDWEACLHPVEAAILAAPAKRDGFQSRVPKADTVSNGTRRYSGTCSLLYFRGFVPHFKHNMTRHFLSLFAFALAGLLATRCSLYADPTNPAPDFKEVCDLLRTNLTGATDDNLNRAAIEGLLSRFPGKVSLVGGAADGSAIPQGGTALSKSAVLENDVVYLRIGRVAGNLANELSAAYRALTNTNKVSGIVLDLRFVVGDDTASAQATANLFASKKIVAGSLVVLVNGETRGAAETLAAALRHAGAGLIIGSPTAGEAATFKEFPLRNGERLRIATMPVKSGHGPAIPSGGLQPDIAVAVSADDERAFWENPYASPAQNNSPGVATNNLLPFVDRISEADLVLQKQNEGKHTGALHMLDMDLPGAGSIYKPVNGGNTNENSSSTRAAEPQKPVIHDPVLARAVDLIKGLAVVHQSRP
jgi:hypothetical protein